MNNKYTKYLVRFRFLLKFRLTMKYSNKDQSLSDKLKYIFLDPEIDTFSYNQINNNEMIDKLSDFLGVPFNQLKTYYREFSAIQAELQRDLFFHTLLRILYMKIKPIFGRNINEYVIVRSLKPNRVVELGIKFGLSSLVIAKALERNRVEGYPGKLSCVDIDPKSGLFLSKINSQFADFSIMNSIEYLEKEDLGEVNFVISDSMPGASHIRNELELAISKSTNKLVFQYNSSWAEDVFEKHFIQIELVQKTDHPIYSGRNVQLAKFTNLKIE